MKPVRPTQLSDRQVEVLLELYLPIRLLPEFYRRHPEDQAFWATPAHQRAIDDTGRSISRLINLKLAFRSRGSRDVKLSASGVSLASRIWSERNGVLEQVA